jgi:pimeloyl-ACP methyl ester carboxylesterase/DNA-binding CsgD family transcriptional regulator
MDAPPVQYVTTSDGYDIAYTVSGAGRTLLVTPAQMNHCLMDWQGESGKAKWMEAASERFRVIHYDSRGQGMSKRGLRADLAMEDYERDIEAVVEYNRLERFVLFGFLMFSHVAIRYAVKHPERVEALVLLNPRVEGGVGGVLPPLADLARTDWEAYLEMFTRTVASNQDPGFGKTRARESANQADYLVQSAVLAASSIASIAPTLRLPTLLVSAKAATWSFGSEAAARSLAALIPGARLMLFDDPAGGMNGADGGVPPNLPAIEAFLAEVASRPVASAPPARPVSANLSEREVDVLRLIVAGKSSREVGEALVLSVRTVERHIANIYLKTDTHGRAQVTAYALGRGIA